MVPRHQFSRPQKVTLCRIRDTLWKKTQHDTGISCQDPCIWSNEPQIWCFFMVHVDGWYIIMFPSILRFFPLKRRTCPGRSRRDSLQWFDGTPTGCWNCYGWFFVPRTQMCHILEGWDPIKWKVTLKKTRSVGFGQVYLHVLTSGCVDCVFLLVEPFCHRNSLKRKQLGCNMFKYTWTFQRVPNGFKGCQLTIP